jgi:WD40 repeat protein
LKTGDLLYTLTGHEDPVRSVTISPDGQTLASGSEDNTIKLWNVKTGDLLCTLSGHESSVSSVAISPDGQTVASGSFDNTISNYTGRIAKAAKLRA